MDLARYQPILDGKILEGRTPRALGCRIVAVDAPPGAEPPDATRFFPKKIEDRIPQQTILRSEIHELAAVEPGNTASGGNPKQPFGIDPKFADMIRRKAIAGRVGR